MNDILNRAEYSFLKDNNNIILLGYGGSYSYGTNNENSDIDIRGIFLNNKKDILTGNLQEQIVDNNTDTTIYSLDKIIKLLLNCNPNTIEMLGLKDEHYLKKTTIGQELIDNRKIFLSKLAIKSFGGYAESQLYRLNQKSAHSLSQNDLEKHILNTLNNINETFPERYKTEDSQIKLFIDKSKQPNYDTEIFMDIDLKHYPLRDYCNMWNELQNTVKQYSTVGKRNKQAIEHNKIAKHMMHLIRLYLMAIDILEKEEIITYREQEHNLLMNIRNGLFLNKENQVTSEFYDLLADLEKRFEYARDNTSLPDKPDYNKAMDFLADINERVIRGEV